MTDGGLNKYMNAAAEIGRILRVSTIISLSIENEQTDAGRDGQTCLARPNSQARTGTGKLGKRSVSLFS